MARTDAQSVSAADQRRAMMAIAAACLVVAAGFDAVVGPPVVRLASTWFYTPCEGVLLESSVVDRGAGNRHAYEVVCEYDYAFGGVTRRGDVFRRGMPFATRAGAVSAVERVKQGGTLTVYVDAGRPERAVLSRRLTAGELLLGAAMVVINALAVGVVWVVVLRLVRGR